MRGLDQMGLSEEEVLGQYASLINSQSESIAGLAEKSDKPCVGYTFWSLEESAIRRLLGRRLLVFPGPERAVRALGALVRYTSMRRKPDEAKI